MPGQGPGSRLGPRLPPALIIYISIHLGDLFIWGFHIGLYWPYWLLLAPSGASLHTDEGEHYVNQYISPLFF